jgi:hypothetical protein
VDIEEEGTTGLFVIILQQTDQNEIVEKSENQIEKFRITVAAATCFSGCSKR